MDGSKEREVGETIAMETGGGEEELVSQESGGKGDGLMGERERERERLITVCQVTRLHDRM